MGLLSEGRMKSLLRLSALLVKKGNPAAAPAWQVPGHLKWRVDQL